jgi:PAS domain S-box-containing protein
MYRIIRADGEVRHISSAGRAIRDDAGAVVTLFGVNLDITDHERAKQDLQASEARYKALFDNSLNSIVVYDEQANFVMINEIAANNLRGTMDELVGQSLKDYYPSHYDQTTERIRRVLAAGEADYVENHVEDRWFWSVAQPIYDEVSQKRHVQIVAYDITERKHAEGLEARHALLTLKLEKEQALAEQRAEMLTILSHELRTPLTIISSSSEILLRYHERLTPERRKEKIDGIQGQITHLDRLLNEIDKLTRANRGFMEYDLVETDVAVLCQRLIDEMKDYASPAHTVSLNFQLQGGLAMLDEKLIYHALANLMTNAIKYSPDGGRVTLVVGRVADGLVFEVEDDGIGIALDKRMDLFTPFNRGDNVGEIRGTGLGLSIVKQIVDRHGGVITVRSDLNEGTTFTLFIPDKPKL